MIALRLGERQRFTNKTRDMLMKRKIPTFLVSRLIGFLAHRMMGAFGQDHLISLPEVGVGATAAISGRDGLIPTILDDVFTATRAAFVRHGYLNHAADYGLSLTSSHPIWLCVYEWHD